MAEITITKDNIEAEVLKSELPVLVDFWATWCGPCKMIAPEIEELAKEYEGKLKVGKVNVDEEMFLATQLRIASIPTLMLFEGGKVVKTTVGYQTKEELKNWLGM